MLTQFLSLFQNQLGGKLLIFQNSLPSLGAGRLKLRGDDPRVYGTDKEYALRVAEDPFYKQMAADCTKFQIGINVYAFSDKYTDIASLGMLTLWLSVDVYFRCVESWMIVSGAFFPLKYCCSKR